MNYDTFLTTYVEGYLFGDLANMAKIELKEGESYGAAGYPILASIFAGMELLGYLLMKSKVDFNPHHGEIYFLNYWNNFFDSSDFVYEGKGVLFYHLFRHGLAHTFLTKPGIGVAKGYGIQTSINTETKTVVVDCLVFLHEFKTSYFERVKQYLSTKDNALFFQYNLDSLLKRYTQDTERIFNTFVDSSSPSTDLGFANVDSCAVLLSGASVSATTSAHLYSKASVTSSGIENKDVDYLGDSVTNH